MLPTYSSYTAICLIWRFWRASVWCASIPHLLFAPARAPALPLSLPPPPPVQPTHPISSSDIRPLPVSSLLPFWDPFLSVHLLCPFSFSIYSAALLRCVCVVLALRTLPAHSPHFSFLFYFSSTLSPPLHRPTAFRLPFFSFFFFFTFTFLLSSPLSTATGRGWGG